MLSQEFVSPESQWCCVGALDGMEVGDDVGFNEGEAEGSLVGVPVGEDVGEFVGAGVGGTSHQFPLCWALG